MFRKGSLTLSSCRIPLRILITAIFLFGLLPVPALAQTDGIIAGLVTDNMSNALPGARILVFPSGSPTPGWTVSSDASGNYTVAVPEGSDYQLAAFKEGFVTGHAGGQNVTANTTTMVDFSLVPGGIIRGIIRDESSNPVENVDVCAYLPAAPATVYSSLPTAASGNYSITVPPGAGYTVAADKPGVGSANQTGISAAEGSPVTLDLTLLPTPPEPGNPPPADITDLATGNVTEESVILSWTAPGSDNHTGQASQYDIRYAPSAINDETKWNNAQPVPYPPPPNAAGTSEIFTVDGLSANTTYYFAIRTKDDLELWSGLSNSPAATTLAGPPEPPPAPPPGSPYFNITHSQDKFSFMLAAGANITETINITSVNDFEGTIDLHLGGPPEIENNSSVSPQQVTLTANQTQTVTLNIGTSPMMPSGTYQCGLDGQTSAYGGQQRGFFFTIIIGVPGQPLLSASPPVVAAGNPTNIFAAQFPASSNITLKWDSGPNAGQAIATGQTTVDGTWAVQFNIPAGMPGGNFFFKAFSGQATAVCPITVTSGSGPDYLMSTSPQFVSITPGQSANITVYVTSINGFNAPVALSVGTAPGVTRSLSAGSVTPASGETASAILTITVADWASPNMYQMNVDGSCADPPINKVTNINLDIQPPAEWGPGISLSQSYAQTGDTITVTGANFPPECNGANVTIMEAFSSTVLPTTPATITVNNGSFTGTITVPQGIPSGNYRIKAIVVSTGDFAERDFQILGTGETFTLGVSPQSTAVATEEEANSSSVSVNIFSVGGANATVNLALEGVPSWLTYQFGTLPVNTAASGSNAVSVPPGGSASRNLNLTASMTAPTGTYAITIKGWETDGPEQRVSLDLTVQPPAGFGMAQFNLSPTFGQPGQVVNFSGSGFFDCTPSQVTELKFGPVDLLTAQSLPTITVPTEGDSAGRLSGTFRVPDLQPGTYFVNLIVGTYPQDTIITKSFTITGPDDTFVLQASPPFLWAEQGHQMNTMIKVQAVGSSSPTVILAVEGCPPNITTGFASGSVTAPPGGMTSTDLNLDISDLIPAGHYSFTIKGQRDGSEEVHRIPIEMDIVPPAGFGMASIYLNPTAGSVGTWITISGNGFPASANLTHLYFGQPIPDNDWVANPDNPSISTDDSGAFSAVLQVPAGLNPGMYPIEVVVGTYPDDRRAMADFTFISDQATFNINLSPMMIQAAPGTSTSTQVNIQAFGSSSTNVTLRVEGPPTIEWRFDGGAWQTPRTVSPSIGSNLMSSLEIQPKPSTSMGHYSLAVKAMAGEQTEIRNLELDVGASSDYNMPIFSLNPNTGTAGTNVSFSGSNFPASANITRITFGSANITLAQTITTSPQGSFSGAFTVPASIGGQPIAAGTYPVRVFVGQGQAEAMFNVYSSDDTFILSLSPNFLQGGPGTEARTSGLLKALGGASPAIKMSVKGLPPGVETNWNGSVLPVYSLSAPPGGQNNFELGLVLPDMVSMGQYPAVLEGWIDTNENNLWDTGEKITRVNLELSIMPPQGYGMGMLSLSPTYGRVGDTITFSGSGFPAATPVTSLTFAQTDVLTANITTADDGSFSGVFTVPDTAFGNPTGPGRYPVDVIVGTYPDDRMGGFDFQVVTSDQKFAVSASPGWLARPAGDIAYVSISVRSLVTNPPSPNIILQVEGLPWGVTASFTSANVTPPVGGMEGRELQLAISSGCPMGNYPMSIRAYNAANPAEEIWADFTLEVTPSSGFQDMGMAMVTLSPNFGAVGEQITVSGYGFPKSANLTQIRLGPVDVTPTSVNATTDATGAFSAVITVPSLPSGMHPVDVNVQNVIRNIPFNIMGADDTFSLKVSPSWLEPIPAGDPNGRQIAITVTGLPGKTPTVTLSTEGLFAAYGTITQNWNPASRTVNVTSAGGAATATLTLIPSENLPPGPYPFNIVAIDNLNNRRDYHMEFQVGPPAGFMDTDWMTQEGVFFPDIFLSPRSGPAGTQVTYTGTNLPAGANVTAINFAGITVPLPSGGITADGSGGFSGSFIVNEAWGLAPGGMYWVNFHMETDAWYQDLGKDFNLMRSDAAFSLEATPNWIPPIPPDSYGQTNINVKALGYNSVNVTLAVVENMNGWGIPGGAQAYWNTTDGPATTNASVTGGGQTSRTFYLKGASPGHYMITIVGWIDSNDNKILDKQIQSEADSEFSVPLDFDVEPPEGFKTWDMNAMMDQMGMGADDMYLFYFPEIVLSPNVGPADTKVSVKATDFPANATVTRLRFAGMDLPVPANTAADNVTGDFTLVFNVPKTMWGAPIGSGWYDVEVEAQNPDEPPVFIMKPFQVTAGDVAFTLRADPDWLPPIPPGGNASTLIRVKSTGNAANVTLSMDKIPPGITTAFSPALVNVPPGGSGTATLTLTPTSIPPGHYGAEIKGTATISGNLKTFFAHIEFDVEPPEGFMTWDMNAMMDQMGMGADDMYLFYFPEIVLNPNMGQAGKKVTITATDFPPGANVTRLRFAGMDLPVPANTAADNVTGDFTLVFNVPKTMWGAPIGSGWYDVEVEAQNPDEPPVFIIKPFQVTAGDVAFTLRADPDWLPPIPPEGSTTTIRVTSMGAGANVTLSMDKIPPGITTAFSPALVNVPPGGSGTATLTLTPTSIPPGHYGAEIKGTATISGNLKTFFAHIEFDVEPATMFTDVDWMEQQGVWFPEITLNPTAGPVKTKVTIKATDFPAGANFTSLRFAGRALPIPANTVADTDGNANLVFNVPGDYGVGQYMIEVEASKDGMPPVFIAKPFFIQDAGVTFNLNVVPGFIPGVPQGESGNTTIFIESTGQSVTVQLYVDGLPPGVTATFESATVTVPPGGSGSTKLTITTRASTGPGMYPLTIRGVNGSEVRMMPFGFGVMPPANFQVPKFTISPDYAPASYYDKQYKITFSGAGFPPNKNVASLDFGGQSVPIPANLTTDANGNFNGVFQMPTGLTPGTYDVRVAVADGSGGYLYDSRPFSIKGTQAKFILKLSPPYLPPVLQGGQGTTIVNVQSVGTTAANVTLSVDGLAPGITATFAPGNIVAVSPGGAGSATLTLNVSASTPPGPYPLNIRGTSGSESIAIPLGFGIMPDIGGGEGHATITINPAQARPGEHIGISGAGFTSGNTITLTAAPPGAPQAMDITPGVITVQSDGTWATEITVPPAGQVPPGSYIIKASDGAMASKNTFSIVPATNADFFLNVSPQFIEVVQGQSGNTTMKLSSKNGFQEPVVFSVGHLAPGVTATFKNAAGTTISKFAGAPGGIREIVAPIEQTPVPGEDMIITVLIDVDVATPLGPYDVALEAGSGTVFRAIPLGFMVISTGANLAISPQSGPADTDITLSGSGFTAGETITIKFAGSNITTVPATVTAAPDGTFTAVITAPALNAGIYPVKVTGGTSGTTIERPFSLKPSAVNTFVLYTSPMKVGIPRGGSGTVTAKIEPLGSFQSAVTLSISGLNAISGATANISPAATLTPSIATPTTATLTINVPAGATAGKYPLVITGTSGAITQTRTITLNVVPPADTPDFAISLAPNTLPLGPSSSSNTTVTVTAINGFTGTVNLSVAMSSANATWPPSISYTAGSVTPSANTGLGKQALTFTADADAQPGTWTFRVTGTSGTLTHSTSVMVICTPSGTTITPFASPRLDPTTITASTPMDMEPPWGDKITINGIINDSAEASIITPAKVEVAPDTLANLPEGASDMLGRVTNVDSDSPVDGVEWHIGFPFDPTALADAGLDEENLKVAYLNPDTGTWTEITTTVDTTNKIAYASPTHFSSWTLIATPAPPPSEVVTVFGGGGGGGAAPAGITSVADYITPGGRFGADFTAESADGSVVVSIPKNTVGKNKYGAPLYLISIQESSAPSAPPAGTSIIGPVYNIGPSGATFEPPIYLTFEYDDSLLPAGVDEEKLVIATWQDGSWVELEGGTVDPVNNTIIVPISHFSIYAVIAHTTAASFEITGLTVAPAEIDIGESAAVSAIVVNTSDLAGSQEITFTVNESVTATEEVSLAGHTSQEVSFTLKPDEAGIYTINIGGVTATLIVREVPGATKEEPAPPETPTIPSEAESAPPEAAPAPVAIQPLPFGEPEAPAGITPVVPEVSAPEAATSPARISDWLIFLCVVAAGLIIVGLVYWRTRTGRKIS